MAASSCVGGDSGVRREVEYRAALPTDFLDWSAGVKGADFTCALKNWGLKHLWGSCLQEPQNQAKCVVVHVYHLDISQLEKSVYVFVVLCHITAAGLKGSLDKASNRWDRAHLSSASRVCFVLLFPASDNVAHIMGSCTALR